jgi:23S rRNA (guanosine2251-2'-O)-methyltransferase
MTRKIKPDRKPPKKRSRPNNGQPHTPVTAPVSRSDAEMWLYGHHPVFAAMKNSRRRIRRILATTAAAKNMPTSNHTVESVTRRELDDFLPDGAVHQGIATLADPLPTIGLDDICRNAAPDATVVVLDQVSDPHNVGAVLRSAAVFGAAAVITPARGAPPITGVLAKAASGALERVPLIGVSNLARTLADLKQENFWCIGLDGEARDSLSVAPFDGRIALVLGAEGGGLRRLTRVNCDLLATIPAAGSFATLNVSNAAAVALYEIFRRRTPSMLKF